MQFPNPSTYAMKVTILRSTQADGGKSFDRGDTPDLSKEDAHILIADGAAVPFVEKESKSSPAAKDLDASAPETAAKKPATGGKAAAAKQSPSA